MRLSLLVIFATVLFSHAQEAEPLVLETSPFPLYGTLLNIDKHELGQMAMYISFYNESPKPIKGFTGLVQFIKKGELILEVMLKIDLDMPSEENAPWYGAVPYDYSNKKESSLLDENVDDIEVHIVVKAIVTAGGYEKVYSAE